LAHANEPGADIIAPESKYRGHAPKLMKVAKTLPAIQENPVVIMACNSSKCKED